MTFRGAVLYALIALVPVVFYRGVSEVFEFPKTELLATGALLLTGAFVAREIARARERGVGTWACGLGPRIADGVKRDPLGGAIALFLFSAVASAFLSARRDAAFFGAHESEAGLKTAFSTAAVYFTSRSLSSDPRHLGRLARAAASSLAVALFYAILQLTGLDPFPWTRSATIGGVRRVPGTLGHANHLGAYIAMAVPLLAWLAANPRPRGRRLLWIGLAAASLPLLAVTLSRGAWVACAAGAAVFGLLAWRARFRGSPGVRRVVLGALVLVLAAFLLLIVTPLRPELLMRLRQITDLSAPSTQSRVHLWRAGIAMALDYPALGVGTDGYLAAFPRYRTPEYWNIEWNGLSAKAHDELIQIAATQGLLGLLAALLVLLFGTRAVLGVAGHRDPAVRTGAAATGGALAAFAVSGLAGFTVASTGILAAALAGWTSGSRPPPGAGDATAGNGPHAPSGARPVDPVTWGAAAIVTALLWGLLVLLPWIAETAAAPALQASIAAPERVEGLRRASAIAPWDARYASELGRALLARAFGEADSARRAEALAETRAAFERAVSLARLDGELHALLGRTLAARAALDPGTKAEPVRAEFDRAISLEPENANVLELAAQGYLEMGRTADARTVALRCARLYPDFALPMADLGVAALLEGRPQAAADTLTLALRRNWHGEEGAALAAKTNYVAALRELRLGDVLQRK